MKNDQITTEAKTVSDTEKEWLEDYHNVQDPKDNAATKPPPGEDIRVPTVWAIEVYPPTFIENLWNGLGNLGVLNSRRSSAVGDFLENIRTRAFGGGWVNLDPIVRNEKFLFHGVKGPLPDDVSEIRLSLHQLLPSTTILICQFFLEGDTVSSVEAALQAEYTTYTIPKGSAISFIDVGIQKEEAVAVARKLIYTKCTNWINEYLPGYFCSDRSSFSPPTCDLITFKLNDLFEVEKQNIWRSYLGTLDLDSEFYQWKNDDIHGLYLQVDNPRNKYPNCITLTGKIDKILSNVDTKGYGKDHESQILNWFRYLDTTLATWALQVLSIDIEKQLLKARDLYGTVDISTADKTIDRLFELDHTYSFLQRNLIPFANDLKKYCKYESAFMHDIYEFTPIKDRKYKNKLFCNIRKNLLMLSEELISVESQINITASRLGQIVSAKSNDNLARSNFKLQKQVAIMSFAVLLLTIVQVCFLAKDYTIDWKAIQKLSSH